MNHSLTTSINANRNDRANRGNGLLVKTLALLAVGGFAAGCTSGRIATPNSGVAPITGDTIPGDFSPAALISEQAPESL